MAPSCFITTTQIHTQTVITATILQPRDPSCLVSISSSISFFVSQPHRYTNHNHSNNTATQWSILSCLPTNISFLCHNHTDTQTIITATTLQPSDPSCPVSPPPTSAFCVTTTQIHTHTIITATTLQPSDPSCPVSPPTSASQGTALTAQIASLTSHSCRQHPD